MPSSLGLFDMHGNVWEWVLDYYADTYPGGSVADPTGPATGDLRVVRGGSFLNSAEYCRSAMRGRFNPSLGGHAGGFRIVAAPGD